MRLLFQSILLLLPIVASAQGKSLLWKITSPNGNESSYLFGTMHLIPEERYFFTPAMTEALKKCSMLVLETDLDVPMGKQLELAQKMLIPENKGLADLMSAEEYARLRAVFVDSLGLKDSKFTKQYSRIKPVFMTGLIMTDLLGKVKMYEHELSGMAKKNKMTTTGLETIDEQMDIMDSYPITDQIRDLQSTDSRMMTEFNRLLDAYVAQNLDAMRKLSEEDRSMGDLEARFLVDRNRKWVPKIGEMAQKQPTFFAVGALHLAGPEGLVEALRTQGWKVEAVN
jgi:uncharacterized protein YbaP (TraB family)